MHPSYGVVCISCGIRRGEGGGGGGYQRCCLPVLGKVFFFFFFFWIARLEWFSPTGIDLACVSHVHG